MVCLKFGTKGCLKSHKLGNNYKIMQLGCVGKHEHITKNVKIRRTPKIGENTSKL